MYITIIGSGKVATVLATTIAGLKKSQFVLRQIVARDALRASALAQSVNCSFCTSYSQMEPSDIYLIAVSDRAIEEVSLQMAPFVARGAVVAHTSGGMALNVICSEIERRGVFYPLISFYEGMDILPCGVPILVENGDCVPSVIADNRLIELAHAFSSEVQEMGSKDREVLHVAAVFANNFSNLMQVVASDILSRRGLSYNMLKPLVLLATQRLAQSEVEPKQLQTGPAVRGDIPTLERHHAMLAYDTKLQQLYDLLTQTITERVKNG